MIVKKVQHSCCLLLFAMLFTTTSRAYTSSSVLISFGSSMKRASTIFRPMSAVGGGETSIVSTCRDKIRKALDTDDVIVTGAYDDPNGSHISIQVVSPLFVGKRQVQRQQLVYKALWEELKGPVHAVDNMICKTPEEK